VRVRALARITGDSIAATNATIASATTSAARLAGDDRLLLPAENQGVLRVDEQEHRRLNRRDGGHPLIQFTHPGALPCGRAEQSIPSRDAPN
jgi:hypothetical protein